MQMLRSYLFLIWLYGWMAICGVAYLPTLLFPRVVTLKAIGLYGEIIRVGLRLICGIRTEIRGREHIVPGPALYAGKHHCMLDVFIPFIVTREPCHILKQELAWTPFLGWYAMSTGMIAIDRAGNTKTLKKMVEAAKQRAGEKRTIIIFPEGTRRDPNAPPDYQAAGISALNKALNVPIIPVATNAGLCWPARGRRFEPGLIIYEVLPAIPGGLDRKTLMARLEADLETASRRLIEEGRAAQAPKGGR
jgi:1-acyl-sn-glycerol-3-phosphate acyltransferase